MTQIFGIALNTFREAVRNRIFLSLILFAVAMLLITMAVSSASLNEELRLMKDVGLFLISTFSVLISIFIGVNLVYKEIERKTVYTVIPKPIYRFQFLLGKYLGLAITMASQLVVMALVLAGLFWAMEGSFGLGMLQAILLIYVEVLIVISVALLFSSFSTPLLSGLLTVGTFIVGRFVEDLMNLRLVSQEEKSVEGLASLVKVVVKLAPDLSIFNTTPYVVYETSLPWGYLLDGALYGLSYIGICLLFASLIFSRRSFI